jgi:hypothetical protein
MPVWEYYARNAEEGQRFARGMGNLSAIVAQEVVQVYDPAPFTRIVDVGGSQGALLRTLLSKAPGPRGVIFDLPEIIEEHGRSSRRAGWGTASSSSRETFSRACRMAAISIC